MASTHALQQFTGRLAARVRALLSESRRPIREAVLRTHILNQAEMRAYSAGMELTEVAKGELVESVFPGMRGPLPGVVDFGVVLFTLRRDLAAKYPFWIPNHVRAPIQYHRAAPRPGERQIVISRYEAALPRVLEISQDSEEFAQLFIDARHDPVGSEPWPLTVAKPWAIVDAFLSRLAALYRAEGREIEARALERRSTVLRLSASP